MRTFIYKKGSPLNAKYIVQQVKIAIFQIGCELSFLHIIHIILRPKL